MQQPDTGVQVSKFQKYAKLLAKTSDPIVQGHLRGEAYEEYQHSNLINEAIAILSNQVRGHAPMRENQTLMESRARRLITGGAGLSSDNSLIETNTEK